MGIIKIPWTRFVLIYLLLLVVLFVMKKCRINKTKMLVVASVRMTVQLIIAGFILTYVINANNNLFVIIYILVMATFSSLKVFKGNHLSDKFKAIIGFSVLFSGLLVECFYVGFGCTICDSNFWNAFRKYNDGCEFGSKLLKRKSETKQKQNHNVN